ncbi:MAG: phosphatase PAP2 family protein [Candidatus Aminicenantes bacterium]|nr:MAG: phosphatase PAP2 family protein [Candidatus Aminicenantes bacterium]
MAEKERKLFRSGAAALAVLVVLGSSGSAAGAPPPSGQSSSRTESAESRENDPPLTLKQAGREFISDAGRIWSSPARIRNKHIGPLIALTAATALLIAADEPIRDGFQNFAERHGWAGDVAPVLSEAGGGIGAFAAAGAFFGAGLIFKDPRARDTGYLAVSAMLQCVIVNSFLKGMTGRQRPLVADGEDHWFGPSKFFARFEKGQSDSFASFPSGHAATAFSLATVVAIQYRHRGWVPVVAYSLAAGAGLSRMTMDKHWASDVAIGAVIGHLVARLVVRNHDRRRGIVPMLACTGSGVSLSVFWDLDRTGR